MKLLKFSLFLMLALTLFFSKIEARHSQIPVHTTYVLNEKQRSRYDKKYHRHHCMAHQYFNLAKKLCRGFPLKEHRKKAQELFTLAESSVKYLNQWPDVISKLILSFDRHGLYYFDEYRDIESNLLWADYHFCMAIFHSEILNADEKNH